MITFNPQPANELTLDNERQPNLPDSGSSPLGQLLATSSYLSPQDSEKLIRAYRFAKRAHRGQFRKSGEHYIYHPLAVAHTLANLRLDIDCLCAALLHDVIEDCAVTTEELQKKFGILVATLVESVSKLEPAKGVHPHEQQRNNLRRLLHAMSNDKRVVLIKLADRLHNISTLTYLSRSAQSRIGRETLQIYAPLARRLGLYDFYRLLADQSFKALFPFRFAIVQKRMQQKAALAKTLQQQTCQKLQDAFAEGGLAIEIQELPLSLYSQYLHWKKGDRALRQASKSARLLLIAEDEQSCYQALWKVHKTFKPKPRTLDDFIAQPKSNSYSSLHTQVNTDGIWSLIIIRSRHMHQICERGCLSDLIPDERYRNLTGSLRHIAQSMTGSIAANIEKDFSTPQLTVYAAEGAIDLPLGATAIDAAFALNPAKAEYTSGCLIDGLEAPLSTRLDNGNSIKFTRNTKRSNWRSFSYATSAYARIEIQRIEATRQPEEALQIGRQKLETELARLSSSLEQIQEQKKFAHKLSLMGAKELPELLQAIGYGRLLAAPLAALFNQTDLPEISTAHAIKGAEACPLRFAECCYPVPGDAINGILVPPADFVVHRGNCDNINGAESTVLEWNEAPDLLFTTCIRIQTEDIQNTLSAINKTLWPKHTTLLKNRISPETSSIYLLVAVRNLEAVQTMIRLLRLKPSVQRAYRSIW
ncbi:MAG: HD domain-containing protein [Gammaproteobacteria bacterium]